MFIERNFQEKEEVVSSDQDAQVYTRVGVIVADILRSLIKMLCYSTTWFQAYTPTDQFDRKLQESIFFKGFNNSFYNSPNGRG